MGMNKNKNTWQDHTQNIYLLFLRLNKKHKLIGESRIILFNIK